MEVLHCPNNIKVHFAGCEVQNQFIAVETLGVRYFLYTAYPFVERKVMGTARSPIMPLKWQKDPSKDIPANIYKNARHVIQDSGLFTLMFGSMADKNDKSIVNRWYDGLVDFTLNHGLDVTCVEMDCQKLLGVEKAWEFRERMKRDLPNNRIINVFHLEDGQKGLDRMIEFSDYIAISVPELRFANKKNQVPQIARYIKKRKNNIDIHLLGCTELGLLKECNFCTSSDSTTYTSSKRYGTIGRYKISKKNGLERVSLLDVEKVKSMIGEQSYKKIREYNSEDNTCCISLSIEYLKRLYARYAGNQDYKI